MDQRGTSLSLYSVICPRCETVSPMDQPACPYCGADRHGAVMTKGAETAVRAVEAARAVLHHAYERGELIPVEPLRPITGDACLPAPVRPLGLTTMVPPRPAPMRTPHPVLMMLMMLMAAVIAALMLGVFSRIRSDLDRAAPRSRLDAVSAAGEIRKPEPVAVVVAPKAPEPAAQNRSFAMALPSTTSLFHNAAPIAFAPSTHNASADPVTPPAAKPAPEARKPAVARHGASTAHARIKQKEKGDTRIAAQSSSNRQKVRDTACAPKNAKRCADLSPRRASKEKEKEPAKRQQPRAARRDAPAPSDANAFQQVNALPAPIKPAMTSDDSWKPGKRAN